jgi:cell division protein FtsI/penicillin-binding protein 2
VYVTPGRIDMEMAWPLVVKLTRLEDAERVALEQKILERKNLDVRDRRRQQQILVKVDTDRDSVAYLETHERELEGIEVAPSPVRYYPFGALGAHLVGTMREVSREELGGLAALGYRSGDRTGAIGIERRWESYLRGQRGMRKTVRGAQQLTRTSLLRKPELRRSRPLPPDVPPAVQGLEPVP